MTKTLMQILRWPTLEAVWRRKRDQNRGDSNSEKTEKTKMERNSQKLLKIDEVDEFYRSNPFIRSGYREPSDIVNCLKSVLAFHNETVNIWSHFLGFVFFLGLFINALMTLPLNKVSVMDLAILVSTMLCYQACMFLSSLFHTFSSHKCQKFSKQCLSLDLAGISLALLATYLSGIHYAFWCQTNVRDFYLVTVAGIFAVAFIFSFLPKFADEAYSHIRIGLFTSWAVYGLIPTAHFLYLEGGAIAAAILPRIFIMYAICGVALLFYIAKFPERMFPGLLDIIGHSHQWWHVLIFIALLHWHHTGITFAMFRFHKQCDATLEESDISKLALF